MADKELIGNLWDAMRSLYEARYRAAGPEIEGEAKHYPKMDVETFSEIATLQTKLQTLITRLEKS